MYFYKDDPVDSLSAGAMTGELMLKSTGRDRGVEANLFKPGTKEEMLHPMRHVKVIAMNSSSMVLEGYITVAERPSNKSKANTFTVRWIVKHVGAPAVVDAKRLQKRSAVRLRAAMGGFDPRDDDRVD